VILMDDAERKNSSKEDGIEPYSLHVCAQPLHVLRKLIMPGFFAISGVDQTQAGAHAPAEGSRTHKGTRMGPWSTKKCAGTTN